ncbi:hypothetical protein [Pandoraea sp. NPDC087047]|uniref:hypothetical protein n=1 Tax=Pandoraea sp. NPDC087047 TaxID=3364390 RepID=UPI00382BBF29
MSLIRFSRARTLALGTALVIGASMTAPVLAASNLSFMQNSPLAYMKKADNESFAKAARDVLSDKQDNDTVEWTNKGTRNPVAIAAQLTATNTQKDGDKTCRDLVVLLTAKGQEVTLKLPACKTTENGHWELQKRGTP